MRIKPSYFDYGGEVDICHTYLVGDKLARLCVRRAGDQYELYARTFLPPALETVISRGSLEEVIKSSNTLMQEHFGPGWVGDIVVAEDQERR
jgi:hypothetical protein